jgi:hypothetical protein
MKQGSKTRERQERKTLALPPFPCLAALLLPPFFYHTFLAKPHFPCLPTLPFHIVMIDFNVTLIMEWKTSRYHDHGMRKFN